jgi:uncharacterized damage-inducible protein DinB
MQQAYQLSAILWSGNRKGDFMPSYLESFRKEFEWEMDKTRKMLKAVPDHDPDFTPHEKSMKLGKLAGHVADLPRWISQVLENDTMELDSNFSDSFTYLVKDGRDAMLARFEENVAHTRAALAATNEEHLAKHWKFIYNGHTVLDLPRDVVITDVCKNHLIHHRGQLSVYVRLLGGKVPGLYGPSADDKGM